MTDASVKKALQIITEGKNMDVLNYFAGMMIMNWQSASAIGQNEWETVRNTISREERAKALRLFLQEIERVAHE